MVNYFTKNYENFLLMKEIFGTDINVLWSEIPIHEWQGDLEEAVMLKCKEAFSLVHGPLIVEQYSLCCNSLNGMPSHFVNSVLSEMGTTKFYTMLDGWDDKSGHIIYTLGYLEKETAEVKYIHNKVLGTLVPPSGTAKYIWDSIFKPAGYEQTYAAMDAETVKTACFRCPAMEDMLHYLKDCFLLLCNDMLENARKLVKFGTKLNWLLD